MARKMIPGLIPREEWGARYDNGFADRPLPVTEWWLHHSVTVAPDLVPPFDDDDAAVRRLEAIGEDRFDGGISYTVPITPAGRAYEGHSIGRRGAHTKDHNTVGAAIVFVGNYEEDEPSDAQVRKAADVLVAARRAGLSTVHRLTGGHRDVGGTLCPGGKAYAAIPRINALADQLWQRGEDRPDRDERPAFVLDRILVYRPGQRLMRGGDIRAVQRRLIALGYELPRFGPDSYYGEECAAAVRRLQADKRFPRRERDGRVGKDTARAMGGRWVG